MYKITTATKKISALTARLRNVQGGTGASKTVSIILHLTGLSQADSKPTLTSIVSESVPHLKRGAMRDFLNILKTHRYYKESRWNRTDKIYTFEGGSQIEFFSADQPDKVRGPRRDRLFCNEVNNITKEAFEQMEIRTNQFIYSDWNPISEFWMYELMEERDDFDHITLTYKDNEALDPEVVKSIETRKHRKEWWKVYGLGQLGEAEGRIYSGWKIIEDIPHEARLERRWLDFGYSNDPSAIGDLYYYNGGYILDEQMYLKGMKNKPIADFLLNLDQPKTLVIADSAEPKSIDEISDFGVNILPCEKGKDSIVNGITIVQDQKFSVTKRSLNILKEYRNYLWETDRDGKVINVPQDIWNHHMDGIRYVIRSVKNPKRTGVTVSSPNWSGYGRVATPSKKYTPSKVSVNKPAMIRR